MKTKLGENGTTDFHIDFSKSKEENLRAYEEAYFRVYGEHLHTEAEIQAILKKTA